MMNQKVIDSFREVLGEYLTNTMKEKGYTLYDLEKKTNLPGHSIKAVITGQKNYTIDNLCKILHALDLYVFFAEKDGKHLDFEHMQKKMKENDPGL
jgi:predicted transcriptional regulator